MTGTHLDCMIGKSQAKLPAGHHGLRKPPVITAYDPPAPNPISLHLHLHHTLLGGAPTSQPHLQGTEEVSKGSRNMVPLTTNVPRMLALNSCPTPGSVCVYLLPWAMKCHLCHLGLRPRGSSQERPLWRWRHAQVHTNPT